jgi:hypothetical protein
MQSQPFDLFQRTCQNSTSTAYEASRVIKGSAGVLVGLVGYNSSTSAQFIHIYDSATLPADGVAPTVIIFAPAQSNFVLDYKNADARFFTNGIVIGNSSTGPTKTIGAANCWFDVQFR